MTTLIDQSEVGAAMSPAAGVYGGSRPAYYRFEPLEERFHGRSRLTMGRTMRPLLGCECGEWGVAAAGRDLSLEEPVVRGIIRAAGLADA